MSIIKEINDLPDSLKAVGLSLLLMPFWYVSIYLFNNEFYLQADQFIILSFCFIFSVLPSLTIVYSMIKPVDIKMSSLMAGTVTIIAIWLSLLIFIVYSIGFLCDKHISFYYFLIIFFVPIIVISIIELFNK